MLLQTLATLGPLHGYSIAARLEEVSAGAVQIDMGTLYPGHAVGAARVGAFRMEHDRYQAEGAPSPRLGAGSSLWKSPGGFG